AQDLVDTFFKQLDHSIRELGISDMGVAKRMKKLAKMFYGRAGSYGKALDDADEAALAEELRRNIQLAAAEWPGAEHLAPYALAAAGALASQSLDEILAGAVTYPLAAVVPSGEPA